MSNIAAEYCCYAISATFRAEDKYQTQFLAPWDVLEVRHYFLGDGLRNI